MDVDLPMHLRRELAGLGLLFLVVVYQQISRGNQPSIRAGRHRFEGDLSSPLVYAFCGVVQCVGFPAQVH